MTPDHLTLLEASVDRTVEFHLHDGTRFLATPLFVYTGPESPDVFFLPVTRNPDGSLTASKRGQSILLEDILAIHPAPSSTPQ